MPHCTADYPWYVTKFALGFASILFLYMGFLKEKQFLCVCGPRRRQWERNGEKRVDRCLCSKGTGVDAEEGLRQKFLTKTAERKDNHQLVQRLLGAAVHENKDEIAQSLSSHMNRNNSEITPHLNYEVNEGRSKTVRSKRKRYSATAVVGCRRLQRYPRCKRYSKCSARSSKRNVADCQRNQSNSCEEAQLPNITEKDESQSLGIIVRKFCNDRDEDDEGVKTFKGILGEVPTSARKECEDSRRSHHVQRKEMHTISEQDLACQDHRNETILHSMLGEANDPEENHGTLDRSSEFYSRTSNRTTWGLEETPLSSGVRCARSKCSRCLRHLYYDDRIAHLLARNCDYFESLITTAEPKKACRFNRARSQGLRCPFSYEVSLDAFRNPKERPRTQNSFTWKVAVGIYEILRILKNSLVQLLAEDEKVEGSFPKDENSHWVGKENKTTVGIGPETSSGTTCYNYNKVKEIPEQGSRKKAGCERASAKYITKLRKSSLAPNAISSGSSSISSSSSSSSFGYSRSAPKEERIDKKAMDYCRQDIGDDRRAASAKKSTADLNKENLQSPTETMDLKKSTSDYENLGCCGHTHARNSSGKPFSYVEDMLGDELRNGTGKKKDVSCSPFSVLLESEDIYEIKDLEVSDATGRQKYSDKNIQQCQVSERRFGKNGCARKAKSSGDRMYCNLEKILGTDSTPCSNCEYYHRLERGSKLSARRRAIQCRKRCQLRLPRRNYAAKRIMSKPDWQNEQPDENLIQSHLEYFKNIELEEITLGSGGRGPLYSMIPCNYISGYRFSESENSDASSGSRRWDEELIGEQAAPLGHWRKKTTSCSAFPRSFTSTSRYYYM